MFATWKAKKLLFKSGTLCPKKSCEVGFTGFLFFAQTLLEVMHGKTGILLWRSLSGVIVRT
ncbi:hypothetical protein J669_2750 [Acinetobacter baumannii 1295549]|nr:hypothetical protein J669_2750 [Acinetobacter baumannii 1295549]EXR89544.1 hypothetical protein J680_3495 [Acinetobacter baumannii 277047]EXS37246.1 hypothetical protein J677_2465 [Acinetobacter baumannii 426863]